MAEGGPDALESAAHDVPQRGFGHRAARFRRSRADADGRIDVVEKLAAIARLGHKDDISVRETFEMEKRMPVKIECRWKSADQRSPQIPTQCGQWAGRIRLTRSVCNLTSVQWAATRLMNDALARLRLLLAIVVIATIGLRGGVPPIVANWRSYAGRQERDFVSREAERYPALVQSLPASGAIGYLPEEHQTNEAFLRFSIAQYVLTPRVVVLGTQANYVIAGPETLTPDDDVRGAPSRDPRLRGFVLYASFPNGMRVFRRFE